MKLLKNICHNEASLFKASCGYLMRLTAEQAPCPTGLSNKVFDFCRFARLPRHFVPRNDSSRGAMSSPPSRRSNETLIRRIISRSEVVELLAKRAAMFGLDARIALAIFGALSVISGAALYSVIKTAEVTAKITQLSELTKAYDAYYLDIGEELEIGYGNIYLKVIDLVDSSKEGWKGPYINASSDPAVPHWIGINGTGFTMVEGRDNIWIGISGVNLEAINCKTGTITGNCAIWMEFPTENKSLVEGMDEEVDGTQDALSGNFRYYKAGDQYAIFFKHRLSYKYK